ncbi:unnamed protein product [Sphenostylis stenocarpa]|uniref:RuvB-like helicase n=1 Tax=Sphenostylis stenocarpa TaxID=92480 RepID=A0AA86SC11_9FABA|nr:unnamed protein product [Sphenostylis stenocarpa]
MFHKLVLAYDIECFSHACQEKLRKKPHSPDIFNTVCVSLIGPSLIALLRLEVSTIAAVANNLKDLPMLTDTMILRKLLVLKGKTVRDEGSLGFLVEIEKQTSLRHAVQLLSPANIVVKMNGHDNVCKVNLEEVSSLYLDAKSLARGLEADGCSLEFQGCRCFHYNNGAGVVRTVSTPVVKWINCAFIFGLCGRRHIPKTAVNKRDWRTASVAPAK